ncbi:probable multidrug resistance-associated protein lethal(2)03659 isoform X1 [Bradysia coprophila]|uniref:probable multidrug resistance-associated protein lethal(2)03659 isoform X1 n=1 Tax=Bradysia coprophila TaxID=38358 RepID=UPI00187DABC0|nr:probable multidrug resistance-associated protein lethal(2)03659 isoform X1 [Bradysia coprophila]
MNQGYRKTIQKDNPLERANILSVYTFWWMKDVFKRGMKGPIPPDEIYRPKSTLESEKNTNTFIEKWSDELKLNSPSILRAIFKIYGAPLLLLGISFSILETAMRVLQPLCLGGLVAYFAADQTHTSKTDAYWYAGGIVFSSAVSVITFHPFFLYIVETGAKARLACSGLVYRKTLALSKSAVTDGLNGKVINLIANDVHRFELAFAFFHDVWKGPLEAVLFGYFIYQEIGVAGIIGMGFLLSFVPIQAYMGKKTAQLRLRTAKRTDFRVKIMNEIILGIQVIKMYAWEKSFATMVDKVRRKEVEAIRGTAYIRATLFSFGMVSRLSIFVSLVTYIFLGNAITAQKVFVVFSFFNILNLSMVYFWPLALTSVAEGYISAKRIEEFLLTSEKKPEELQDETVVHGNCNLVDEEDGKKLPQENEASHNIETSNRLTPQRIVNLDAKLKGIVMKNVTATWNRGNKQDAGIYDFNLEVEDGSLCAIAGPVGSGKSTLLNVIIGELDVDRGYCRINGSISYACQETWLFEGTIRSNIIFIEEFDQTRYKEVVRVCGLERDFKLMPNGDMTVVGERGISLSGGQKARISLARAVYKQADIYLLDDPLSAVDSHVGKHLFQECIQAFLKGKICVLVTHQLQYLKDVNHLVLMYHGRVESQGTYVDVQQHSAESFLTMQAIDETGNEESNTIRRRTSSSSMLSENSIGEIEDREELQAVGAVHLSVYQSYFNAVESVVYLAFMVVMFLSSQSLVSAVDIYISQWSNWEERMADNSTNKPQSEDVDATRLNYIITYGILMAVATYVYVHRTFAFFFMCLRASMKLHDKLFQGVTRAAMVFYNNNPSGRILNRFSRDISNIDTLLPPSFIDCLSFFLEFFATIVIVAIANYWLLIPTLIMTIFFYILRYIYISTARSIKRVESLTLSPIYSHINSTLQGLSTVRASKAQHVLESEFYIHSDYNTGASYLKLTTNRAFAFWLDVVCVFYIGVVTFSFLVIDNKNVRSGNIGLAILNCINLIGMCQWGMRQTAEIESQMTSVERVMEYADLKSEAALESEPKYQPPPNWPSSGEIRFNDLNFKYSENGDFVLRNVNLLIRPREKIGIVGRTGAGKSSIVQAIFRLAELNGEIVIDGIATSTLGLHDLRKRISIIPQEPVLFSGTLRFNLDPFDEHTDGKIWDALEQVELKSFVSSSLNGLDCRIMDGGLNFSMGQRQLVCLARAILRNNKILICDEATANVDPETDKLIQTTIRKKFSGCSVLTIAHRLHTVMDNDRILVIDAGNVVEFGHPYELLQRSDGHLTKLVNQTGSETSDVLMRIAAESFSTNRST